MILTLSQTNFEVVPPKDVAEADASLQFLGF